MLTTGSAVPTRLILVAFGPDFEFGGVLAFIEDTGSVGHAPGDCHDGVIVVDVTPGGGDLFDFFLVDSCSLVTLEIRACLEALTAKFAKMGAFS